ncbi:MAG: MFS transporter [Alphaproteobacteria bacterium]|nr:MFS transporter [Alphaproteobacteria bacterium]
MTDRRGDDATPTSGAREDSEPGWRRLVAVATLRPFCWYLLGLSADSMAIWMQRLAVGWLVWELTGSTAWLGIIVFLKFAPTIVLGMIGGVMADRFERRTIIAVAEAVSALQAAIAAGLYVVGLLDVPVLVGLTFCVGVANALAQASGNLIVSELVPPARVASAIALNSVVFNVATVIGPAIAGAIMFVFGIAACLAAIAACFALHLVVVLLIRPLVPARRSVGAGEPVLRAITTALGYAFRHPGIGPLLALHVSFTMCVRPLLDMLPAFAGGELGEGVETVSLLTSLVGVGAIGSGVALAWRRPGPGLCTIVLAGMAAMGLAMLGFAFAPSTLAASPLALVIGIGMTIRSAATQTLLQIGAAEDLRGRVLSLYGLGIHGGTAIGGVIMGLLAEAIGLRLAIATMTLGAMAVLAWVTPRRRHMRTSLEAAE